MNIIPITMKIHIKSTRGILVAIVFICNVLAPVYAQPSLVSQSINTSTITGETVEFNCAQLTELHEFTNFKWSLNGSAFSVNELVNKRMSLKLDGSILMITNVTSDDNGIYKCEIFNKFRSDHSIFNLTVREIGPLKIHKRSVITDTLNVDESARWNCLNEILQPQSPENVNNVTWLKNGKPFISSSDRIYFAPTTKDLTLIVRSIELGDQGIYECTAYTKFRIDSVVYNITVIDSPNIMVYNYFHANYTRYIGESVSWNCILSTNLPIHDFSYTWFKNDEPFKIKPGDYRIKFKYNSFTFQINGITHADRGNYKCAASNGNITGYLKRSLTVLDKPEIDNFDNWYTSNITAVTGTNLKLTCESFYSSRNFVTSYQWTTIRKILVNEKDDKPTTEKNLSLHNIIFDDNGIYYCDSTNIYHVFRSTYTLNIVDLPDPANILNYSIVLFIVLFSVSIISMACYGKTLRRERALKKILEASRAKFENGDIDNWNPDLGIEEQAELLPYDKQWEFPRDKLKLGKQLGSGAFGVVYKAEATGIIDSDITSTVAVKMIKSDSESSHTKGLVSELKIMIYIGTHLNVVNLLGACTEDINNLMVIVEYCRFGNIREYLHKQRDCFINQITPDGSLDFNIKTNSKNLGYVNYPNYSNSGNMQYVNNPYYNCSIGKYENKSIPVDSDDYLLPDKIEPTWHNNYSGDYSNQQIQPLSTYDLLCWSFQVARGMEYLASKKILHGDLAMRNILLADDNIIKICDFGFAKTLLDDEIYKKSSSVPLPIKWMAIESIRDRVFSSHSDVWSFGIVLWEMFSLGVNPYPNIQSCFDLFNRLNEGYRMEQPMYANSQIYRIMLECWKMNPLTRPSFTDLVKYMGNFLLDSSKSHYINLNEVYVKKYTKSSYVADYINLLNTPNFEQCSTESKNTTDLNLKLSKMITKEYNNKLETNQLLHNKR